MPFATVEEAAELYRRGEVVIIVDDEDRENEGDLCIAAEKVTPESINFMARYGRGLICLAMTEERCQELDLPLMVEHNTSNYGTAFTVSIEARGRVTTGISAHDRAETVRVAIDPRTRPADLLRSEEHTSELQSLAYLVCRLLLEKKKDYVTICENVALLP